MNKTKLLTELAHKRQQAKWDGFHQLAEYHNGIYECDFVSPYTKSAGNVDADIFILLQDWCSHEKLSGQICADSRDLGHTRSVPTNQNLKRLLQQHLGLKLDETYGTNLFPFIKKGDMSSSLPLKAMIRAAEEFALPQIEIVAPKIVICLGLNTFRALRIATGLGNVKNFEDAFNQPFEHHGSRIWLQAHTGRLGQNNRNAGGVNRVDQDWQIMAQSLQEKNNL